MWLSCSPPSRQIVLKPSERSGPTIGSSGGGLGRDEIARGAVVHVERAHVVAVVVAAPLTGLVAGVAAEPRMVVLPHHEAVVHEEEPERDDVRAVARLGAELPRQRLPFGRRDVGNPAAGAWARRPRPAGPRPRARPRAPRAPAPGPSALAPSRFAVRGLGAEALGAAGPRLDVGGEQVELLLDQLALVAAGVVAHLGHDGALVDRRDVGRPEPGPLRLELVLDLLHAGERRRIGRRLGLRAEEGGLADLEEDHGQHQRDPQEHDEARQDLAVVASEHASEGTRDVPSAPWVPGLNLGLGSSLGPLVRTNLRSVDAGRNGQRR